MEKGIASVEGDIAGLRSLPPELKDLESAAHGMDATIASFDGRFADLQARIVGIDAKLDTMLARPLCTSVATVIPPKLTALDAAVATLPTQPRPPGLAEPDAGSP